MGLSEDVVNGTLHPDGSLDLDQKPNVIPGRVTVSVQVAQGATGSRSVLSDVIDEISRLQQVSGDQGRTVEQMAEEEQKRREEEEDYEQRMQQLHGQAPTGPIAGKP